MLHEGPEEVGEGLHLFGGGERLVEIPDKGDANGLAIHTACLAVGTFLLLDPPRCNLDLPVTLAERPVVNDKMISQALPEPSIMMGPVDQHGVADVRCRVVNDDVFPLIARVERYHVAKAFCVGDHELLPDAQGIFRLHPVGGVDVLLRNVIHAREAPDGFEGTHFVNEGLGLAGVDETFLNDANGGGSTTGIGHFRTL